MKVTREQFIQLWTVLNSLAEEKTTAKGAYGIAKNRRIAKAEIEAIQEAQKNQKVPEGIYEFETKRIALCEQYADKDEAGKPILDTNPLNAEQKTFRLRENIVVFNEELQKLMEEYKPAIEERDLLTKQFQDFLKEETDIDFWKISFSDLPNKISAHEIDILGEIIAD
jgi:hypothetical protein